MYSYYSSRFFWKLCLYHAGCYLQISLEERTGDNHPFLAYIKDTANDKVKPVPMCVNGKHLVHDATTFSFQK